jgi:H+/gluconate symporter-like permease
MKNVLAYLFAVLLLGSFMGLLMLSTGGSLTLCLTASYLFWGCMLTPMLIVN